MCRISLCGVPRHERRWHDARQLCASLADENQQSRILPPLHVESFTGSRAVAALIRQAPFRISNIRSVGVSFSKKAVKILPLFVVVVTVPSGGVGIEELLQHGSQKLRGYLVGLTFQGAMLCMGHRLDKRQCCDVHKRRARRGSHDECRHRNTGCSLGGDRGIFTQDGGIVGKGGRYRFEHWPHGMLAHPWNMISGHPHQHHKERHSVASTVCCKQFLKLLSVIHPCESRSVIRIVWCLVHGQFLHLVTELDGCLHGKSCAGGDTEHGCLTTRYVDEGFDVFNFTLNGIRLRISALASSPTIIFKHGEVLRQEWRELRGL